MQRVQARGSAFAPCAVASRAQRKAPAKPSSSSSSSSSSQTILRSTALAPVALVAAASEAPRGLAKLFTESLQPQADFFSTLGLPDWLVHWGHPGNMAVVLVAMGIYGGGYLGWTIRLSDDEAAVAAAKALHPKLSLGALTFFALGALGGLMSLLMQGKPLTESPHFVTGTIGLLLLALQGMLSAFFDDDPSLRGTHAYLGSAILALLCVHAVFGLQLGLSI